MCILPVVYAGHFDHMKSWFSSKGGRKECPTGCGCLCEEVYRTDGDAEIGFGAGPGIGRQVRGEPSVEDSSDGEDSDAGHEDSDAGYEDDDLYRKYFSQYK
jgi:hypothetical protein